MSNAKLPINLINGTDVFLKRRYFSSKEIIFQPIKFLQLNVGMNGEPVFVQPFDSSLVQAKIIWLLDGSTQMVNVKEKDGDFTIEGAKVLPKNWLKQQEDKYAAQAKQLNELAYQYLCIRHNQTP